MITHEGKDLNWLSQRFTNNYINSKQNKKRKKGNFFLKHKLVTSVLNVDKLFINIKFNVNFLEGLVAKFPANK